MAIEPSYASFLDRARGKDTDWDGRFNGQPPDPEQLLAAARVLSNGHEVDLVTIDLPISTCAITGRRRADVAISQKFGAMGCSTHTPSQQRPGLLGHNLTQQFEMLGYPVATANWQTGNGPGLVEVYPHPALLTLLNRRFRLCYKVDKSKKYWPDLAPSEHIERLIATFSDIAEPLAAYAERFPIHIPNCDAVPSRSFLKRYEDALDAAVCAWVGAEHLAGRTTPFGDDTAAIWVP